MNSAMRDGKLTAVALDAALAIGGTAITVAAVRDAAETMVFMRKPLRDGRAGGAIGEGSTTSLPLSLRGGVNSGDCSGFLGNAAGRS
jgi:hypothetical protein